MKNVMDLETIDEMMMLRYLSGWTQNPREIFSFDNLLDLAKTIKYYRSGYRRLQPWLWSGKFISENT